MSEVFRIIYPNSHIFWFKIGTRDLHREDGPAFIDLETGYNAWYQNGVRHRLDGPAVENFFSYKEWRYHGQKIDCQDQETFERIIKLKAFW